MFFLVFLLNKKKSVLKLSGQPSSNGATIQDFNKSNAYIPVVYDMTIDATTRAQYFSFFGNYPGLYQETRTTSTIITTVADSTIDPPTLASVNALKMQ